MKSLVEKINESLLNEAVLPADASSFDKFAYAATNWKNYFRSYSRSGQQLFALANDVHNYDEDYSELVDYIYPNANCAGIKLMISKRTIIKGEGKWQFEIDLYDIKTKQTLYTAASDSVNIDDCSTLKKFVDSYIVPVFADKNTLKSFVADRVRKA